MILLLLLYINFSNSKISIFNFINFQLICKLVDLWYFLIILIPFLVEDGLVLFFLVTKGCSKISSALILFVQSFSKHFLTRSFASELMSRHNLSGNSTRK